MTDPITGDTSARDLLPLPRALALSLWTASYLRGDCGPDDAVHAATGQGHRHVEQSGIDLFDWMTQVRRLPIPGLLPLLPEPGRIAGLVGPPSAVSVALEASQALVVSAAGIAEQTLVPVTEVIGSTGAEGVVVQWDLVRAPFGRSVAHPGGSGARETFLKALRDAAHGSTRLDLVPEEPVEPSYLPASWTAIQRPRHLDAQTLHLLTLAARTLVLTDAELASDDLDSPRTGAVGLQALGARTRLLRELRDAARDALVDVAGAASLP